MKILIIGPSWIGDMMMSQVLYRLLKKRYFNVQIHVIAPVWCQPLLKWMPEVGKILTMPFKHGALELVERYRLGLELRKNSYDQVLVLPNSFKSALVPFFSGIPQRIGWCGEMRYGLLNDIRILNKKAFPMMAHRYAALAFDCQKMHSADDLPMPLSWPSFMVSEKEIKNILRIFALDNTRPIIGFCPGTGFSVAKCWPHYRYASLAKDLISRGYQILILGSDRDKILGEAINSALPSDYSRQCYNLVGKTSLEEAVKLIASCRGVVSNDSGLMHVASALGRPLVALYGPSSPDFTPPLSHYARVIRLANGFHKISKGNKEQLYHKSLIAIQSSQVLNELEKLLNHQERGVNASLGC